MRTLRLSLAGTVILALLATMGGAAVAQDEPADPMAPATVTGTVGFGLDSPVTTTDLPDGWGGYQGSTDWYASDPRLSGKLSYVSSRMEVDPGLLYVGVSTNVLANDDGRWVGTTTGLAVPGGDMEFTVMQGEGAYEGLTAVIWEDWSKEPPTFVGAIIPGEMPPHPEMPAE